MTIMEKSSIYAAFFILVWKIPNLHRNNSK